MELARTGLARGLPGASPEQVGLRFISLNYGPQLAEAVRAALDRTRASTR